MKKGVSRKSIEGSVALNEMCDDRHVFQAFISICK